MDIPIYIVSFDDWVYSGTLLRRLHYKLPTHVNVTQGHFSVECHTLLL